MLLNRWESILEKLEAAKPLLIKQGTVRQRTLRSGTIAWVVRYRGEVDGKFRNRAIYLGDLYFAQRVQAIIQQWRSEAVTAEDHRRKEMLQLYQVLARSRSYSRNAWVRLKQAVETTFGDQRAELELAVNIRNDDHAFRYGRPHGRPARSGLW